MKVAVIGMGYVGAPFSAFAARHHEVVGADLSAEKIALLSAGQSPIHEEGLDELLRSGLDRRVGGGIFTEGQPALSFTTDVVGAIRDAEICFCSVGTPVRRGGTTDLEAVLAVAKSAADAWGGKGEDGAVISPEASSLLPHRFFVVRSTVPAGTCEKIAKEVFSSIPNIHVVSSPEFVAEGACVKDLERPDRIVIGGDEKAFSALIEFYRPLYETNLKTVPVLKMKAVSAELTKLAANAALASKVMFANEMALLCDRIGADVVEVMEGVGSDPRIGSWGYKVGTGARGPCFGKDALGLFQQSNAKGLSLEVVGAILTANVRQTGFIAQKITDTLPRDGDITIAFLGLTFKANTDDCRASGPIDVLAKILRRPQLHVRTYDPKAVGAESELLRLVTEDDPTGRFPTTPEKMARVRRCSSIDEAVQGAHAIIVLTEWSEFRFGPAALSSLRRLVSADFFLDFKNVNDPAAVRAAGFRFYGLGRGGDW